MINVLIIDYRGVHISGCLNRIGSLLKEVSSVQRVVIEGVILMLLYGMYLRNPFINPLLMLQKKRMNNKSVYLF